MSKKIAIATLLWINSSLVLANESTIMETIVVTVTQNPELNVREAPLLVDIITSQEIKEKGITTLHELFEQTPGVDAKTAGPGSVMPMIRGLSDEQVIVLVDGIRLSDERPGGNHVLSIDPAQIERMEIVKGPGSVLYGAGAIGGVINFITKKNKKSESETLEITSEFSVGYESNNNAKNTKVHIDAASKDLGFYLGGVKRKSDNIESPKEEIKFSYYDGNTIWGGASYRKEDWSSEVNLWQSTADIGITAPRKFKSDYYKDEKHSMVNAKVGYEPSGELLKQIELQVGWQEHNRHRIREPKENKLVDIHVDKNTKTARGQMVLTPNSTHRITTGIDLFDEKLTSSRVLKNLPPAHRFNGVPVIAPSSRTGVGVFVQDEIDATSKLKVTTGLRYDSIKAQTDGADAPYFVTDKHSTTNSDFSGSLGAVYAVSEDANLYANIGRAFRSPTLIERYFHGPHDGPGQDLGNPDLKPEKSINIDMGARLFTDNYRASVGVFYNKVDNMIRKTLSNPTAEATKQLFIYENIHDARLYGVEFDGAYYINDSISLFGSFALIDGENTTNNTPLNSIAPMKGLYGIEYSGDLNDYELNIALSGKSVFSKDNNELGLGEKSTPSYTTAHINASVIKENGLSATIAINNLFDRTVYDFLSYGYQSLDYASMGRNIKLEVGYRF